MAAAPGQVPPEVQRLQRLFEVPGNNLCADCGATGEARTHGGGWKMMAAKAGRR